jgi:hypothetical protein
MDALQDFLTATLIFLEYLFFGYIAVAFLVHSVQRQAKETGKQVRSQPVEAKPLIVAPTEQPQLLVAAG